MDLSKASHTLEIKNNEIKLDDFKLKSVTSYEVKSSATGMTELTLKMIVNNLDMFVD